MALYICGYATDPNYPQKLISIIERYVLYGYDMCSPSDFAAAYDFVVKNNISDGSRPKDFATKEEICTMIYRLNKLTSKNL